LEFRECASQPRAHGLLRMAYGDEDIPLESLRKVIETWRKQSGTCAISRIKLAFPAPAEATPKNEATPNYTSSLMNPIDCAVLQHQYEKEEAQRKRNADLHGPVFDYNPEG